MCGRAPRGAGSPPPRESPSSGSRTRAHRPRTRSTSRAIARSSCSTWRRSSSANATSTRVRASLSARSTCSDRECSCWRRRSVRSSIGSAPVVRLGCSSSRASRERVLRVPSSSSRAWRLRPLLVDRRAELVGLRVDRRLDVGDPLASRCSSVATAPSSAFWARSRSASHARRRSSTRCSTAATISAMRSESSRSRTASSPRR